MTPNFYLVTERGRRDATRYAATPACEPELADRIKELVKQARAAAKEGRGGLCIILGKCLHEGDPTPEEIKERAARIRARWPAEQPTAWATADKPKTQKGEL